MGERHPESYISGLRVRQRISRQQPKGLPIVNMGFNEMPYPPPQSVVDAISGRAPHAHRYGSAACNALRQALAAEHALPAEQLEVEAAQAGHRLNIGLTGGTEPFKFRPLVGP